MAKEVYYFSTLFWQRTLHVSDRFTVHHQESYYCIQLADSQHNTYCCEYSNKTPDDGQ